MTAMKRGTYGARTVNCSFTKEEGNGLAGVFLKGVTKVFGSTLIVKKTDIQINDGEFMVIVGPSGCGKTTTLRMIAGLEEPTEGEVYIGDKNVTHLEPKDRDIAMVFQNYALFPHMTVGENLSFGLRIQKVAKKIVAEQVKNAADLLGITQYLNSYPRQLSGGQCQRVALGRAIIRNPQVFLMDEPLSNLDAKLRVQMRAELIKLHQRLKTTVVYVTHDQTEAMTMGTRIIVMKDGVIQQIGKPREIYHAPCNMFVAGFLGSPAMNFIKGQLDIIGETVLFRTGSQTMTLKRFTPEQLKDLPHEVVLGIRPEDIQVAEDGEELTCKIEIVEHVGAESIIYGAMGEVSGNIVIRCPGNALLPEVQQDIGMIIDPEKLYLFDGQTGVNLMKYKACEGLA